MKKLLFAGCTFTVALSPMVRAAETADDTRYGLFHGLDHRSEYTQHVYPEPFLVDESGLEMNEARLDWLHTSAGSSHSDTVKAEIEKGFGLLTLELEVPYERDVDAGSVTRGFANIDLGARYPLYQFVSSHGLFDSTLGAALELGIPTGSDLSKNTELVPKIFEDVKIGAFTVQSIFGYSALFGPGEEGGAQAFEYGFVFAYSIDHKTLPVPGTTEWIPMAELSGETPLNHDDRGHNSLIGDVGLRVNLAAIGPIQPRLGAAYVFPVNRNARAEVHHGIVVSLVLEY
jgi:hypothetical protein